MSKDMERWEYVASLRHFSGIGDFFLKQKQKQLSGSEKDLKK